MGTGAERGAGTPGAPTTNVLLQVFVSGQLTEELLRRALAGTGMTPSQFAVESLIAVRAPVTPSEIAEALGMAPTTVSSWLQRLERAGRVRRRRNPRDGRSALVEPTTRGRRAFERAAPHFGEALRTVQEALGGDGDAVLRSGDRLHAALREALGVSS